MTTAHAQYYWLKLQRYLSLHPVFFIYGYLSTNSLKYDWKSLSKLLAQFFGSTLAVAILYYFIFIGLLISDIESVVYS